MLETTESSFIFLQTLPVVCSVNLNYRLSTKMVRPVRNPKVRYSIDLVPCLKGCSLSGSGPLSRSEVQFLFIYFYFTYVFI